MYVIERSTYHAIMELLVKDVFRAKRAPGQDNYLCPPTENIFCGPCEVFDIHNIQVVIIEKHKD